MTSIGAGDLLRPVDAAAVLCVAVQTLARWRCEGQGPRFVKIGPRLVAYRREDVERWLSAREAGSTVEARRPAA
jgi:predicted DNA-binding transcriptional regulator AlpA